MKYGSVEVAITETEMLSLLEPAMFRRRSGYDVRRLVRVLELEQPIGLY